jgi:hypothetical protein
MDKSCSDCGGEGPTNRHQSIIDQLQRKLLSVHPHARDRSIRDPPAAMDLRSKLRVEHDYRIGHPHQDKSATTSRMHPKVVVLRLESDDVPSELRRQFA